MTTTTAVEMVVGDVTNDSIIDGRDATLILTHYAKSSTGQDSDLSDEQLSAADVNNDNILDGRDASLILAYYAYTSSGHSDTLDDFVASRDNN